MVNNMKIAVLSGKGGTGKTFISVNLSLAANRATYLDCDVEAPNGELFLKPTEEEVYDSSVMQPEFDGDKCVKCRACVNYCKFNALVFIGKPRLFPDICHSCGVCSLVCKYDAIKETPHKKGVIKLGHKDELKVVSGVLNEGEASGVSVIEDVLKNSDKGLNVIDCPPGSACNAMAAIEPADYCVIVAEPTAFGLHNFKMVVELAQIFNKKIGVVINKCEKNEVEDNVIKEFCDKNCLKILDTLVYDDELAKSNAHGIPALYANDLFKERFENILKQIESEVN